MGTDEAKILHHVELNCSASGAGVREMLGDNGEVSHPEGIAEEDYDSDINNVEYELQLRMIDRKSVFLARDLGRRPPFARQTSAPEDCQGGDGAKGRAGCGNGHNKNAYRHPHRHTIHLNDVELGNAAMRRNFVAMNKKQRKKQRLNLLATAECVTHQLKSQSGKSETTAAAAVEIKRQVSGGGGVGGVVGVKP